MKIQNLDIKKKLDGNYFFFAADNVYFDLYGKALALSLKKHAPWANIHVHFYNQTTEQAKWCDRKNISYTNDFLDKSHPEFRTHCACLRFVRIPEIFESSARILAFDCDVIANNTIPREKFLQDTEISRVTLKKGNRALASTVTFGPDNFRNDFRDRLMHNFSIGNVYWFLDQDILDDLIRENKLGTMFLEWTGTKMTPTQMIWTAKGERKNSKPQYQALINKYLAEDR
jgi:hypothetical protein